MCSSTFFFTYHKRYEPQSVNNPGSLHQYVRTLYEYILELLAVKWFVADSIAVVG